jgi:hypothetical protein
MQLHLGDFARVLPNAKILGDRVYHSLPGRKKGDRSCTLMLIRGGGDFVVKDHHRDAWPWRAHRDWVRGACGLPAWRSRGCDPEAIRRKQARQNAKRRLERALRRKTPLRVSRPWEVEGISRTTWYARGGTAGQVPPTPTKFPRGHPLTEDQRTRKPVNQEAGSREDMNTSARHPYQRNGLTSRQHFCRVNCLPQLEGCREHGHAQSGNRSPTSRHHLRGRQSRLGADGYGWR